MRLVRLGPDHVFYRFHGPRWASLPTSGAGAARNGGRFNRPGVEALYLAREVETALAEYRQDALIVPPGTLVAYRLTVAEVVDFSGGYDMKAWPAGWAEHACDWKHIARIEKEVPPTWRLADALITAGRRGLLYPSTRRDGGVNLVLFPANLTAEDAVTPHDPRGDLPKDQSSWVKPPARGGGRIGGDRDPCPRRTHRPADTAVSADEHGGRLCKNIPRRDMATRRPRPDRLVRIASHVVGRYPGRVKRAARRNTPPVTLHGYARVSGVDQDPTIQAGALRAAGCRVVRAVKRDGGNREGRAEPRLLLDFPRTGDTLVITRVDRLARSLKDLRDIVHELRGGGVALRCIEQPIDTGAVAGKAFLDMPGVFAAFETAPRRERRLAGIAAAKAGGVYKGRKAGIGRASVYRVLGTPDAAAGPGARAAAC